jgi:hypothetical protein
MCELARSPALDVRAYKVTKSDTFMPISGLRSLKQFLFSLVCFAPALSLGCFVCVLLSLVKHLACCCLDLLFFFGVPKKILRNNREEKVTAICTAANGCQRLRFQSNPCKECAHMPAKCRLLDLVTKPATAEKINYRSARGALSTAKFSRRQTIARHFESLSLSSRAAAMPTNETRKSLSARFVFSVHEKAIKAIEKFAEFIKYVI